MADKYYIRPRKIEDPKQWKGPFDISQLKDQAKRRLFSKEGHECSLDRVNWMPAREIWPTLFPKVIKAINAPPNSMAGMPLAASSGDDPNQPDVDTLEEFELPVEETAEWFYEKNGKQQGPFTISQLQDFAERGKLMPNDLIWFPGLGDQWIEAQDNPVLFQSVNSSSGQIGGSSASDNSSGKLPPLAIASFVVGILGMTCLPIIGSIAAVFLGHFALMQFSRPRAPKDGKWMAVTGLVLGYVGIAVGFLIAIILVGYTLSNR